VDTAQKCKDNVFPAWQDFIAGGSRSHAIRPQIVESWIRCSRAKVDPYSVTTHRALDIPTLTKVLQKNEKLINIAKPFMANLYKFVKGSGFVVVLTDENGCIMEMFSDEDTLKNPLTRNFFLGASWEETEAGTNAIGTTVVIGEPIQVSGAEHFCQKHHCLTCSAAPIIDTNGRVIGALNMSGMSSMSHLHTLGMVVAAAEAITAQMSIRRKNYELALVNNRLTKFFNTVSDGVIIVDKNEIIVELNPAAKAMLGYAEQNILGMPVKQFFENKTSSKGKVLDNSEPYNDAEIMVSTKDGVCHCLISIEPVVDEQGMVTGGIIILRPIKHVQRLANRLSSYSATFQFRDIIGQSAEIREVTRLAMLAAATTSNILLQGESGTGKEIFAQAIHNHSSQCNGPFIALNCGAIPRELIGSELFGYEEGAFTGAKRGGKLGKFELASGGTLFLDEIGDMPLEQQIALLRVIQEKKVVRIGGDKMIPVNVRLICATNKNLLQEVERGTFRQDLFYRLNVMAIIIPPLRNRIADILLLFRCFLDKLGHERGCRFDADPEVIACLQQYPWPGNVRELQNVVERATSLVESGNIALQHLPSEFFRLNTVNLSQESVHSIELADSRIQRKKLAGDAERHKILNLLNIYAGNVSQVAREMGVSRKTLYNKMHIYSIQN